MIQYTCNECGANWVGDDGPEWCDQCDGDNISSEEDTQSLGNMVESKYKVTGSYQRITDEELEQLRESYKYWDWFNKNAGIRDFTTDELKRLVASEKHLKESVPKLIGVIERLKFVIRQGNLHQREDTQ